MIHHADDDARTSTRPADGDELDQLAILAALMALRSLARGSGMVAGAHAHARAS